MRRSRISGVKKAIDDPAARFSDVIATAIRRQAAHCPGLDKDRTEIATQLTMLVSAEQAALSEK